jgi:hypothetical protein
MYAMDNSMSLNPSPIFMNGNWCLEITKWTTQDSDMYEEIKKATV